MAIAQVNHGTAELNHTVRNSLIADEMAFELSENALQWQGGKKVGLLAYADIGKIALISYPSFGSSQYQCTIHHRGGRKIKIRSHHYQSLNVFEDRSRSYAPFIRELCRRVAAGNGNVHFISGSTAMWLVYLFLVLLMAGVGILLLMALLENLSSVTRAAGALMALALLGPGIWRMRRQGQGAAFDPENPPVSLLGE